MPDAAGGDDDARLAEIGAALAEAVATATPPWVRAVVERRLVEWRGAADDETLRRADAAGAEAALEVRRRLRALGAADVDAQRLTPLQIVREAVRFPTAVLRDAGAPALERDQFDVERFPDDPYGLTPADLKALDPELGDLALAWGAAKALAHRRRHA